MPFPEMNQALPNGVKLCGLFMLEKDDFKNKLGDFCIRLSFFIFFLYY